MNKYDIVKGFICILIAFIIVIVIINNNKKKVDKPPVEEIEIEHLENNHNKLEVEIDSIEHEKKIKIDSVKMYNDSATLELWYKLLKS